MGFILPGDFVLSHTEPQDMEKGYDIWDNIRCPNPLHRCRPKIHVLTKTKVVKSLADPYKETKTQKRESWLGHALRGCFFLEQLNRGFQIC